MINASNIFVGTAGGVYKVGSFAQGATDSSNTVSFAVSPMDKTLATFLVGQSDGTVWQTTNNGSTFTELGGSLATGNAMVAYGPDGTLYAAVGSAVWSYSASAAAWTQINSATSGVINQAVDLAVATNGVMYVGDSNVANFVQRSLNPNQEYAASGAVHPRSVRWPLVVNRRVHCHGWRFSLPQLAILFTSSITPNRRNPVMATLVV